MDYRSVEQEVLGGLKNERHRLDRAKESLAVYRGDFAAYEQEERWQFDSDGKSTRDLPLMSQIIDNLCRYLYRQDPVRQVPGNEQAEEFLNKVYKQNKLTAVWQTCDRYTHASDIFGFQVGGTANPDRPVKIVAWPADSIAVWCDPDDPLVPYAVCTLDMYDNQRRYRLWTAETVKTYLTKKTGYGMTAGGTAPALAASEPNPYKVLPFAFAHYSVPTITFCGGGPGDLIADMNLHVNRRLRLLADAIRYISKPVGVLEGVSPDFTVPKNLKPGEWLKLPPGRIDARGDEVKPEAKYLTPPLDFVTKEWDDINNYMDLTLQSVGVPPAAMRLTQTSARSGFSIVAEQAPLMLYAKNRANVFKYFEEDLARVTLQVASAHLNGHGIASGHLDKALEDFSLNVRYAEPKPDISSQDRRDQDTFLLDLGLQSRVQLAMEYFGLSRDESLEHLKQVKEDEAEFGPEQISTPDVIAVPEQPAPNTQPAPNITKVKEDTHV